MNKDKMEYWAENILKEIKETGLFRRKDDPLCYQIAWDDAREIIIRHVIYFMKKIIQELKE